jgi:hypothetical protein
MKVDFWFDPACPFCWLTSRWVCSISEERGLDVTWRSMSLFCKNRPADDNPRLATYTRTHALLRVCESLRAAGHADRIGDVYREFGRRIHNEATLEFDVAEVLLALGLNPTHAEALDDDAFDDLIRRSMDDAFSLVGTDVGTPIMAVEIDGIRRGFFGPVITEYPSKENARRLWDGYVLLAGVPGLHEIKRTRSASPALPPL